MKLGVATAATQIEGGDTNNSWFDWFLQGKIKDNSSPERANDHYVRFREDTDLLRQMGIQIYRFGVEWSRIEPHEGVFSDDALEHYREELRLLKVLAEGEVTKKLTVRAHAFSEAARAKLEQAGGVAEVIPVSKPPRSTAAQTVEQ
jgi:beta-glucosidase/6-phospho-beta-glucosidase/beta-galactosidase